MYMAKFHEEDDTSTYRQNYLELYIDAHTTKRSIHGTKLLNYNAQYIYIYIYIQYIYIYIYTIYINIYIYIYIAIYIYIYIYRDIDMYIDTSNPLPKPNFKKGLGGSVITSDN